MLKRVCLIAVLNLLATPVLYAEAAIHSLKADARAKVAAYNPNQVYHLRTHYLVSTDIIFGQDEWVGDYHLGDAS